jgi:DnaJ-domain-containing protein 1
MGIANRLKNLARVYLHSAWSGIKNQIDTRPERDGNIPELNFVEFEEPRRPEQRDDSGANFRASGQKTPDSDLAQEIRRCYAELEVPYGADLVQVKSSWHRLLRKYHPDIHSHDAIKQEYANRLTQELTRAYRTLEKYLGQK